MRERIEITEAGMAAIDALPIQVEVGGTYRLAYPAEYTTLPEYTAHAGATVRVLRRLLRPTDNGTMFHIEAADGWQGVAYESELEPQERG